MIEMLRQNDDKFWKRVAKRSDSECWLWMTYLDRDGYGLFQFRHDGEKKRFRANRVSYMLTHGNRLNIDQFVCHTCDNPQCVNPSHLILGDCKTNIDDCVSKHRQAKGIQNGRSKLTEEQVRNIRVQLSNGQSHCSIAKNFNVTRRAIFSIAKNDTWQHVV